LRELGGALNSWGASEASNGSVALGTAGFFLGGLSDALASMTNPIGSLWNLGEASYTVAQRDGDVAGVAYGLGSLIGATQATEAIEGENFLTGQALTGLDRWGMAFQGTSAASGVAAVGLSIAGIDSPLDFGGWFRTAAAESAAPFRQIMANLQGMDFSTAPNTALSYSGTGTGDAAEALAAEKGLTTISGTEGGAYLQSLYLYGLNSPVSESEANSLWTYASGRYASGASGDVTAILNNRDAARVYMSVERPILLNNPNVTSLNETTIPDLFLPVGNFH
jgi:hypothetical protein